MKKSLLSLILSKTILILVFAVVCAFILYGISSFFSEKYKTDIFGYSQLFESAHNKANIKTLNDLIGEKQYDVLAKQMNLNKDIIKDIKKIEYYDLVSDENTYFKLTLISYSNKYFQEIASGIQYYYQNQTFNKTILTAEEARLNDLITFKAAEIATIDSILNKENNFSFESDLFTGKNEIKNELEETRMLKIQVKGLNFLNEAIIPANAYFPNRTLFGLFGFVLGFLIAMIFFLVQYELNTSKNA